MDQYIRPLLHHVDETTAIFHRQQGIEMIVRTAARKARDDEMAPPRLNRRGSSHREGGCFGVWGGRSAVASPCRYSRGCQNCIQIVLLTTALFLMGDCSLACV